MRVAVFTMVYNEAVFLPMWLSHYGRQVGPENLFVVDVGSDDGSTANLPCNLTRLPRTLIDEERRAAFVHHFHASLLSYYDVAVFCDTDEFLVADPALYPDLKHLLADRPEGVIAGIGVNVVHLADREPPLDRDLPVLAQRRYAQFDSLYCKPLIGRTPIQWTPGFHTCVGEFSLSTGLYLFHLKAVDQGIFLAKSAIQRRAGISASSREKGYGVQNESMSEQDLLSTYFQITSSNLASWLRADFSFLDDLQDYVRTGFRGLGRSTGSVGEIPERFRDALPALHGSQGKAVGSAVEAGVPWPATTRADAPVAA